MRERRVPDPHRAHEGDHLRRFERLYPGKIVNITNGVTPRRWLHQANPDLSKLITSQIGECWLTDLSCLANLRSLADDAAFREEFRRVKRANKARLAESIEARTRTKVSPDSLFDVQAKRIHEYKRQLLNVLHVITRYNRIREGRTTGIVRARSLSAARPRRGISWPSWSSSSSTAWPMW